MYDVALFILRIKFQKAMGIGPNPFRDGRSQCDLFRRVIGSSAVVREQRNGNSQEAEENRQQLIFHEIPPNLLWGLEVADAPKPYGQGGWRRRVEPAHLPWRQGLALLPHGRSGSNRIFRFGYLTFASYPSPRLETTNLPTQQPQTGIAQFRLLSPENTELAECGPSHPSGKSHIPMEGIHRKFPVRVCSPWVSAGIDG